MKADPMASSFDLHKVHVLPVLTTNTAYYKHQLSLYNEGVHNVAQNQGYAYLWTEDIAHRGAREISSVIYQHVTTNCQNEKQLSFWCDNCWAQNKKNIVAKTGIYIVNATNVEEIDICFLYRGHTFLPDDSNFGNIERQLQKKDLYYTVGDYIDGIGSATSFRKNKIGDKKKIIVRAMKLEDFKEFNLSMLMKRNMDAETEPFLWPDIHHMNFKKGKLGMFFRHESFGNGPFRFCDMGKERNIGTTGKLYSTTNTS